MFLCLGLNDTGKIFYIYPVDLFFEIFAFNECAMLWEWLLIISFDFTDLQKYARTSSPVFVTVILIVFLHGKESAFTKLWLQPFLIWTIMKLTSQPHSC